MFETKYHSADITKLSFLITGGAGFIGSNIVEYLLKHGARKVRVIDNLITSDGSNLEKFKSNGAFEFYKGDLRNVEDCRYSVKGIDVICHQAALGSVPRSVKDPVSTNDHTVASFVNLIAAANAEGIKRIVYASSSSVYGDSPILPKVEDNIGNPISPYAVSKYACELYAKAFGPLYKMEFVGLRYFNVFGPNQSPKGAYAAVIPLFVDGLLNGKNIKIYGDGEQTRDFTFVENVVQANVKGMLVPEGKATNQVYNVAYSDAYTVNDLYNKISVLLNIEKSPEYLEERAGDIKHSLASIEKAKQLLGYEPIFDLENGLEISMEHYKKAL